MVAAYEWRECEDRRSFAPISISFSLFHLRVVRALPVLAHAQCEIFSSLVPKLRSSFEILPVARTKDEAIEKIDVKIQFDNQSLFVKFN